MESWHNNLITAFLQNRTQAVGVNGACSLNIPVKSGVPQGSVLCQRLLNSVPCLHRWSAWQTISHVQTFCWRYCCIQHYQQWRLTWPGLQIEYNRIDGSVLFRWRFSANSKGFGDGKNFPDIAVIIADENDLKNILLTLCISLKLALKCLILWESSKLPPFCYSKWRTVIFA